MSIINKKNVEKRVNQKEYSRKTTIKSNAATYEIKDQKVETFDIDSLTQNNSELESETAISYETVKRRINERIKNGEDPETVISEELNKFKRDIEKIEKDKLDKQMNEKIEEIKSKMNNGELIKYDDLAALNELILQSDGEFSQEFLEKYNEIFIDRGDNKYESPIESLGGQEGLDKFNETIRKMAESKNDPTKGPLYAAIALSEFTLLTGKNFRYDVDDAAREEVLEYYGIKGDMYLDCSSYVFWAIHNGGYNWPTISEDDPDYEAYYNEAVNISGNTPEGPVNNNYEVLPWARVKGYAHDPGEGVGKSGDILSKCDGENRHTLMIIGTYDGGYYVLEEAGYGIGLKANKKSYDDLAVSGYQVVDMHGYYSNESNRTTK